MEQEEEKRMEFINENIIEAGVDLEEITKFAESQGKSFDSLKIDEIKNLLDKFNNKEEKKEEAETKKEEDLIVKGSVKAKIIVKEDEHQNKEETNNDNKNEKSEDIKDDNNKEIIKNQNDNPKDNNEIKKEEIKKDEIKKEEAKKEEEKKPEKENNQQQIQKEIKTQPQNQTPPPKELPKSFIHKGLYYPESYDFKTVIQQKNKLLELSESKKPIQILISEPKKESEGGFFFSKAVYSYRVQCPELGSDVRRTYSDFEWLQNQLSIRYPLRLAPVFVKENMVKQLGKNLKNESDENYELRKIRYLNKFINSVLNKKIFRTSPVLYEFLILDEKKLIKYKNILDKKPYELEVGLNNLITVKGEVKCSLEQKNINDSEILIHKAFSLSELYNRIITNLEYAINDFHDLSMHLKNISLLFNYVNLNLTNYKYSKVDDMKNSINNLKALFEKWSKNMSEQSDFFSTSIKENLNYMSLELIGIDTIYKKYKDYRNEYEDFTTMIKKEKNELIDTLKNEEMKKDINKGKDPKSIKFNKKAFDEIFYNKNLLLIEEKKRLSTTMHLMNKDYNKLMKIHMKKIKEMDEDANRTIKIDFIKGN